MTSRDLADEFADSVCDKVDACLAEIGLQPPHWWIDPDDPDSYLQAFTPDHLLDAGGDDVDRYQAALLKAMNLVCDDIGWPGLRSG